MFTNTTKSKSINHTRSVFVCKATTSWANFLFTTKDSRLIADRFQVHSLDFLNYFQMYPVFLKF